jgi:CheY-specific phosphatase CheX
MKAEFINPFASAVMTVFLKEFGMNVMREQLDLHSKGPLTGSDVNTIIGVTGQLEGQVIYTFEEKVAVRIASALIAASTCSVDAVTSCTAAAFSSDTAATASIDSFT